MACLTLSITPVPMASLAAIALESATLAVTGTEQLSLSATPTSQPVLTVTPEEQPALTVQAVPQVRIIIGEVCSVGRGTIVVLAASDGPLRTRDGGYFLLNPETN